MSRGFVWLVGAGPGDPKLLTLRGLEVLREADVVVFDRLVDRRVLDAAPPAALRLFAGKRSGHHALAQETINDLLVSHARRGKRVVRLKGGDPFVFGRGGEEALALADAGIPFEIVPGVTSAIAVPAVAGIPVTHRDFSSSFAVVTGHEAGGHGGSAVDWKGLATAVDTLVVLMGATSLPRIAAELVRHGRPPDTPVALIRSGTTDDEVTVTGTLRDIVARAREAELGPPIVAVIGEVVRLNARLARRRAREALAASTHLVSASS